MAHCNLCDQLERLMAQPEPVMAPLRSGLGEVASLIPGDLLVNTERVRVAIALAVDHTEVKQATVERALYNHLSSGNPFDTWLIA